MQQLLHKLVLLSFLIQEPKLELEYHRPATREIFAQQTFFSGEKFATLVQRGGHFAFRTQLEPSASSFRAQM